MDTRPSGLTGLSFQPFIIHIPLPKYLYAVPESGKKQGSKYLSLITSIFTQLFGDSLRISPV